jgi:hypothetical protein
MPVIPAAQEAEIRRIAGKIVWETPSQKHLKHKLGLVEWIKL